MLAALVFPLLLLVLLLVLAWVEERLVPPEKPSSSRPMAREESQPEAVPRRRDGDESEVMSRPHPHEPAEAPAGGNGRERPRRPAREPAARTIFPPLRAERRGAHRAGSRRAPRATQSRSPT